MAQQTAVEWLVQQLKTIYDIDIERLSVTDKAKQMEKDRMANFANEYADAVMGGCMKRAEQYYNETYNAQQQ